MKTKQLLTYIFFTVLALSTLDAKADFVNGDYLESGDQRVFLDTHSGLEWLALTETTNKSINMVNQMLAENQYPGFRLATESEIKGMLTFFAEGKTFHSPEKTALFSDIFGLSNYGQYKYSYGLVQSGEEVVLYGSRLGMDTLYYDHKQGYSLDYHLNAYSVFLVSDSKESLSASNDMEYLNLLEEGTHSVPAPLSLFGMFVIGFFIVKRKTL